MDWQSVYAISRRIC